MVFFVFVFFTKEQRAKRTLEIRERESICEDDDAFIERGCVFCPQKECIKGRKRKGITLFFDILVMRWEFFVLFLDDDDVGATWESDNLFYFS